MYTIFHCGEESILSRNFHPLEEHLLIPRRGIPRGKREEKEEREEGNKGRAEGGQSETRSIEAVFGRENRPKDGGNCGKFRPFIPRQWGRSRVLRKFSMLRVSIMLSPFSFPSSLSSILFFSLYWFEGDARCISAKHFVLHGVRSFLRRRHRERNPPSPCFRELFSKFLLPGENHVSTILLLLSIFLVFLSHRIDGWEGKMRADVIYKPKL